MAAPAINPVTPAYPKPLEDPLAYLPCSVIAQYRKGQLIYGQDQPAASLYVIISGTAKICRLTDAGKQVVVDILQTDDFFGESALLNLPNCSEHATALEDSQLMVWSVWFVQDLIMKRPQLGIALLQMLIHRTQEMKVRLESLAVDNIPTRLARALVYLSGRFGVVKDNGTMSLMPFTHELLAQYVGTSREIVTHYMNQIRKHGHLQYSRKGIVINRESLLASLQQIA